MGIVKDIIYKVGQCPPALPLAVVIEFKYYSGANFVRYYKKSVLILTLTYSNLCRWPRRRKNKTAS